VNYPEYRGVVGPLKLRVSIQLTLSQANSTFYEITDYIIIITVTYTIEVKSFESIRYGATRSKHMAVVIITDTYSAFRSRFRDRPTKRPQHNGV